MALLFYVAIFSSRYKGQATDKQQVLKRAHKIHGIMLLSGDGQTLEKWYKFSSGNRLPSSEIKLKPDRLVGPSDSKAMGANLWDGMRIEYFAFFESIN